MAAYTVLATRYRPRRFEEVVGQDDAARVLRSSVAGGRSAHAYLFSGPRGVGKTSMARILAKAWNCLGAATGDPCGVCGVCRAIDESGDCLDVVEIDGASHNKVENVRELIENVRFRPVEARHRVYIIDEVHMLSTSAFNALLKTLEEPPSHARFILATTEPLKVPETIRSRCQLVDFRRLAAGEIAERLAEIGRREAIEVPAGLTERVARHARGGMRDALSLFDQLISFGDGKPSVADFERLTGRLPPELVESLVGALLDGDAGLGLDLAGNAFARGVRAEDLVEQLTETLQGALVAAAGGEPADRTPEERAVLARLAAKGNVDQLLAQLDVLVEADRRLRQRHDERLVVDLAIVTLARTRMLQPLAELLAEGPRAAAQAEVAPAPRSGGAPRSSAPAAPRAVSGPADVPALAASDFVDRFLAEAGRGARSLRAELERAVELRLDGDVVRLRLAAGALFDPRQDADLRARLLAAARQAAGRAVELDVGSPSDAAAQASAAERGAPRAAPPKRAAGPLEQRILGDWPGAERVDN